MKRVCIGALAALALAGCSVGQDGAVVDQAVSQFHQDLGAGRNEAIFDRSAAIFQNAKPKAATLKFMDAVHRKLGDLKSTNKTGWRENLGTMGHVYVAVYQSTFANGQATETFTYQVNGVRADLMGFNINSDALITN